MNEGIRVCLISLGCARNLVDSEVLLGHAVQEGLLVVREAEDADVVVVNTCGFIETAKQESIDTILSVARLKEEGRLKGVVAVGCLAQRHGAELGDAIPELDGVLGISDYSGVPAVVRQLVNGTPRRFVATVDGGRPKSARTDQRRMLLTPKSFAYLRISEGCDHKCTFCAIPGMRGRNRSKPLEVLVEEARTLAAAGVAELVVVAEDSTAYGLDLYRRRRIHELLAALSEVEGIRWIRLMYAYPHTVGKDLTAVLRENPKVLPYLDIPIQHISTPMLRAMKRGVSGRQVRDILGRLRDEVPGVVVRSTYIVGFPGETESDFEELLEFTRQYRFERLGVFTFSREEGTPAWELPHQVDGDEAERRRRSIMEVQKGIMDRFQQGLVGRTLPVLVDGWSDARPARGHAGPGRAWLLGRTVADAPEVDCAVRLPADCGLRPGELADVRITGLEDYELIGETATCATR